MKNYYLTIHLQSDTTFGRGSGLPGLVDTEIEHDQFGCPTIGGRSIKGLLVEEWANIRFSLQHNLWDVEAQWLFGTSGEHNAHLHISTATLPPDVCAAIRQAVSKKVNPLQPHEVLASLTSIRQQTAIDPVDGAPVQSSLRATRILLRETDLIAPIHFDIQLPEERQKRTLALLAACILATRRGGMGRNRGRGRMRLLLHATEDHQLPVDYNDAIFTNTCFQAFKTEVLR